MTSLRKRQTTQHLLLSFSLHCLFCFTDLSFDGDEVVVEHYGRQETKTEEKGHGRHHPLEADGGGALGLGVDQTAFPEDE